MYDFYFDEIWVRVKEVTKWKTLTEMAKYLGIKQSSVSGAKNKRHSFPIEWAFKIAQSYKCSTDWLLTGDNKSFREEHANGGKCPSCTQSVHDQNHIFANTPPFDAEKLSYIFEEIHKYKIGNPGVLTQAKEVDIILIASSFLLPDNKTEAELICSIVNNAPVFGETNPRRQMINKKCETAIEKEEPIKKKAI